MNQSNIVNWEQQNEIGILTINNGKENYLNTPDFLNLNKLKEWTSEKDLKGILIKGAGRNFSAGANLDNLMELANNESILAERMSAGKEILDYIEDLEIPVIAVINGVCFGGGLEIALACHMRVASERALFAFPEANHGLIPGLGGTYRLVQLAGKSAFEILLNADMMNAQEAKKVGLVNYVSELKDAFQLASDKLKSMISDRSVDVIHSAMQAINNAKKMNRKEALKAETELFCKLAVNLKFHQKK